MKIARKSSTPILSGEKLEFFYSILVRWESSEEPKVIKNFSSAEIKRLLARADSQGKKVLYLSIDPNKKDFNHKYELYLKNSKRNIGESLLYHLRNAFAHNDIQLIPGKNEVFINHEWGGGVKLKATISYKVFKELVETMVGKHNLSEEEKKNKPCKKK